MTMDVRKKLVELCEDLETLPCCDTYEGQAEYLIAHGVTVQEWISVDGIIADVAPVRYGRWIDKGEYAVCMECGGQSGTQYDGVELIPLMTQFCPFCGAIMDGGERIANEEENRKEK